MKVFNTSQIRQCDQYTVENDEISSIELMEKAALACFEWIKSQFSANYTYYVFCGKGNNGGDGLAIARLLLEENYKVETFVIQSSSNFSTDAQINFDKYPDSVSFLENDDFEIQQENKKIVIIDALFGTGLNKPLEGNTQKIIQKLNHIKGKKISIDIPSGLFSDSLPSEDQTIFKADVTLSFQFYKRAFLHVESAQYAGKIFILDIGLNSKFIQDEETNNYIISSKSVSDNFKPRDPFSHKGNYGKVALIGGSYGKIGSIALSTRAALKIGAGIVFTIAPNCGYSILQTLAPEAMFISGGDEKLITEIKISTEKTTIGIGPGLGKEKLTKVALEELLKSIQTPAVLDADALNIISENKSMLNLIPKNSIITPHPVEFARLFGDSKDSLEQCELAREMANKYNIIIVLKGHRTAVLTPEGKCYYNITGNAGMAKGGSGDILTGMITGLLAQGYVPQIAAQLGVYIHGKAGDYAAKKYSQEAMTAQDIIHRLPEVFLNIKK